MNRNSLEHIKEIIFALVLAADILISLCWILHLKICKLLVKEIVILRLLLCLLLWCQLLLLSIILIASHWHAAHSRRVVVCKCTSSHHVPTSHILLGHAYSKFCDLLLSLLRDLLHLRAIANIKSTSRSKGIALPLILLR